ncbi:MAG: hypothetical protein ACOH13_15170 [Flavobacteriales bacterium]
MRCLILPLLLLAFRAVAQPGPPPFCSVLAEDRDALRREVAQRTAERGGLEQVIVEQASADTVWLRITGGVLLDGGCSSSMPLFSVEMRTDSGWEERIPLTLVQMDCGLAFAQWTDRRVMIPLAWWVRVHSRAGDGELARGSYRLVFTGADLERLPSAAFTIG